MPADPDIPVDSAERRYQQLFENMAAGFALHEIICDDRGEPCDYRFLEVNPAFERLTGLAASALVGRRLREVLPQTEERWIRFFGRVALTGEPAETEDYSRELDRWHEVRAFCPKPRHFAVIFTEVTSRKRAEAAIATSERNYREIFNATSDALFIHAIDGSIVDVNSRMCSMYRCTREQALRLAVGELSADQPPYGPAEAAEWIRRTLEEGPQLFPWRARRYDGTFFWAEVSLRYGDIAGQRRIIASVRDVTDSRRSELALAESSRRLQLAMESAQLAVWEWDVTGDRITWDARMHAIYGTDAAPEPMPSEAWLARIHADDRARVRSAIRSALADERTFDVEFRVLRPDRSQATVKADGVVLRDASGSPQQMVGFTRDVTALRDLEERLRQTQKLDAIGQLAGGIAHDFNNVLGGIMGAVDILDQSAAADSKAKRYIRLIQDAAERASDLTRKLLSFARKQPTVSAPTDLHTVVCDAAGLLEHAIDRRIRIDIRLAARPSLVMGDAAQLQSAVINLGVNAAHAMAAGGVLTISTANVTVDAERCRASSFAIKPGEFIELVVSDTGHGIPPEILPRIFEPFFTTKPVGQGTGLGLAAVFGTVCQHAGSIEVGSEVGVGTRFSLLLPCADASRSVLAPAAPVATPTGTGLILVVDDEPLLRQTAHDILCDLGYTVILAADGHEGLELFRERHQDIAAVLLDMVMPRMNGRDCFQAMRRIRPDARIVLSSGFLPDADLVRMQADGLCAVLRKPYRAEALGRVMRSTLAGDRRPSSAG